MPSILTLYGADHVLAALFGASQPVKANYWLALTTAPASKQVDGLALAEPVASGYARQQVANNSTSWGTPQGGVVATIASFTFPVATNDWGIIVGYALCDAVVGGNVIIYGDFQMSSRIELGDQARVNAQQLSLSVTTITGLTNSPFNL